MRNGRILLTLSVLLAVGAAHAAQTPSETAGADAVRVLAFAPGTAATQRQAQPTMDKFAAVLAGELGWGDASVVATFEPKLKKGLTALAEPATAFAMVPLPAYLQFHEELQLEPLASIVYQQGGDDRWSLVAPKGKVTNPASLSGWTVLGAPGYSPAFVRNVALAHWGTLPADVKIEPASRIFSALRKASKGEEPIAVLLDKEQADSFDQLPFKDTLEIVTSSPDVPGFVFCRVGARLDDERIQAVRSHLLDLHKRKAADEIMEEMRITRFEAVDTARLQRFIEQFGPPGP